MHKGWKLLSSAAVVAVLAGCLGGGDVDPATKVYKSGRIVTMDAKRTVAQAVAIRGNQIVAVGSDAEMAELIGENTEVIDLHGKTMLPGFIDAHIHPVLGATRLGQCSMDGVEASAAEIVAKGQSCIASDGGGANDWFKIENVNPAGLIMTRADLDQISTERPIMVSGIDGHTGWANSKALQLAGITAATPNPDGGVIVHDGAGEPTGSLLDAAQGLVTALIPELTLEQHIVKAEEALDLARSKGMTTIKDAMANTRALDVYEAMETAGTLKMRVRADLASEVVDDEAEYTRLNNVRSHFASKEFIRADGVKIFSDGVIEYPTQTASMLTPYRDIDGNLTDNYGETYFDEAVLEKYMTRLDKDGFRINIHAIGDRTPRAVLNTIAKVQATNGKRDARHQISHLEIVHPDDIPRFAQLGVYANMQMLWAIPDEYTLDWLQPFIDPAAHRYIYPAGSLKAAGATIIGGSDWPVDMLPGDPFAHTPLRAMYMAVKRDNPFNADVSMPVLYAEERVDLDTMLAAYTINAAKGLQMEDQVGSIEVGKKADFVLFDEDITDMANIDKLIFDIDVAETIFDGETVYTRPAATAAMLKSGKVAAASKKAQVIAQFKNWHRSHAACGFDTVHGTASPGDHTGHNH